MKFDFSVYRYRTWIFFGRWGPLPSAAVSEHPEGKLWLILWIKLAVDSSEMLKAALPEPDPQPFIFFIRLRILDKYQYRRYVLFCYSLKISSPFCWNLILY